MCYVTMVVNFESNLANIKNDQLEDLAHDIHNLVPDATITFDLKVKKLDHGGNDNDD